MNETTAREQVVSTGVELLKEGLLVRTWGNISCRLDENHMVITPSGRAYTDLKPEELPVVSIADLEWTGPCKPSSEKGVHASAYEIFPEAGFVIHTHQVYATAISVYGIAELDITPEEHHRLGGLAQAGYGLPGTKTLRKAVEAAMKTGSHTVLMKSHGAVIVGASMEEAVERARVLEEICRRNVWGINHEKAIACYNLKKKLTLESWFEGKLPYVRLVTSDAAVLQAAEARPIRAQLDDMAQMIGAQVPVARTPARILKALEHYHAVLIPGLGGAVSGQDADDTEALAALLEKAAVTARHTQACEAKENLPLADVKLMHLVYTKKYSKQKAENK